MGLINYLMNSDGRRSLRKLDKMARKVEELEPKYAPMTDAQLREQTNVLKDRLKNGETLDDILYDAFAVVREAAWRVLKLKHYHVQIIGGIALHQGRIAEMKTGEGKTLVATLPSYLNALAGKGVHIVTVNDYLARRDADWMGKVHKVLGLTVGVVVPGMDDAAKKTGVRQRHHLRHQQRTRIRLSARQFKDGHQKDGAARTLLRHRRRGRLHSHRRGAHPAHHFGQGG